ncbi:hypothetical protein KGD83_03730 [Nocardiopsis akebiae]|uniref:SAF domain-containing protein n=1 Tax=Nocardiopsis akebiae TaxID=2831968 RepID=A0ABX8C6E1_9ACTN|nr:SAF domain-containing protein [Nocardiopsis akebiae]QUX29697.1 hypothetical protein KGD83_03730 [Nocardiopsis akebiae]
MTTLTKPHSGDRKTGKSRLSAVRRRGWKRPFAGIAAMVLGGVVAAWAATREEEPATVLVAVNDVEAGDGLDIADLRVVSAFGVEELDLVTVPEALRGRAAAPIPAGTVLTGPMIADTSSWPAPGQAVVAVETRPGMLPESAGKGALLLVIAEEGDPFHARLHSSGDEEAPADARVVELLVVDEDAAGVARAVDEPGTRLVLMAEP